jgi:hypothetical protein
MCLGPLPASPSDWAAALLAQARLIAAQQKDAGK